MLVIAGPRITRSRWWGTFNLIVLCCNCGCTTLISPFKHLGALLWGRTIHFFYESSGVINSLRNNWQHLIVIFGRMSTSTMSLLRLFFRHCAWEMIKKGRLGLCLFSSFYLVTCSYFGIKKKAYGSTRQQLSMFRRFCQLLSLMWTLIEI